MKSKTWEPFAFWILFTEIVGLIAGLLTREGTKLYAAGIIKPPLSPPPVVFPIAWVILYALMGISAALVWQEPASADRTRGLRLYLVQLLFNFCWSIIFFDLQAFVAAFFWLAVLWLLILWMTLTFRRVNGTAAWLQIPYLLWVLFAGYLNLGVWRLNP